MSSVEKKQPPFRPTLVMALLGLMTAFAPFATDTYLAGFGDIAASLKCASSDVQLSLSSFFLGLALGQILYGPISDRIGRKLPILAGILIFTFTSLLAVFSPNVESFIAIRFLQAVGGCAGMIMSRAIIRDVFTPQESARALSLLMVVQSLGPIIAPVLGGWILSVANWQTIFIFLVGLGLFCLLASLFWIPETLPVERRRHDKFSSVPKIFWELLKVRDFLVPTLTASIGLSMMFVFISGSPYVFMEIHGVNQQQYGYLFGLNAMGMIVTSWGNRHLLKRWSPEQLLVRALSFAILMSGCGLLALSLGNSGSLILTIVPLFGALAMVPMIGANGVAVAMGATGHHAGSGSSLIGVLQFSIAALASALVSLFHNGTAYPMIGMICGVNMLALIIYLVGRGNVKKEAGLEG